MKQQDMEKVVIDLAYKYRVGQSFMVNRQNFQILMGEMRNLLTLSVLLLQHYNPDFGKDSLMNIHRITPPEKEKN